jgi:hypothetical protein
MNIFNAGYPLEQLRVTLLTKGINQPSCSRLTLTDTKSVQALHDLFHGEKNNRCQYYFIPNDIELFAHNNYKHKIK